MKKIFTTFLRYKLPLFIAFLILFVTEIFLIWKKDNTVSFYQSMRIFVKFTVEIVIVGLIFSIITVLKNKK